LSAVGLNNRRTDCLWREGSERRRAFHHHQDSSLQVASVNPLPGRKLDISDLREDLCPRSHPQDSTAHER
jgi:hypothetical protein